jgi:hypothetical protein
MHPHVFLDGFWRAEIRYQVFVAMPFGPDFDSRFASVYEPAITHVELDIAQRAPADRVQRLKAHRVDNSKSGDSILTEIMDGIAHSFLVLADLSEVGRWVDRFQEVRTTPNGNVMYEVGLALASRQPSEVILVRDRKDKGKLLFDISTIPCVPIDFNDPPSAIVQIQSLVVDRAKEIDWRKSHKVNITLASLTHNEIKLIRMNKQSDIVGWKDTGSVNFLVDNALPGLLSKGILRYHSIHPQEQVPLYAWTSLGNVIRKLIPDQPVVAAKA